MKSIDDLLHSEIEAGHAPGLQYYLFDADKILHRCSAGQADVQAGQPVTESTTFNAYSVTKTFTAVAVMQLAERGQLSIDDPVTRFLPGFPYGGEITIRQLLSHSAGVPNPIPLRWAHLVTEHAGFDAAAFFAEVFKAHPKTKSKPNAKFAYSNLGYILLGQLIAAVSGQTYEAYVTEHILRKLGLGAADIGFEIADPGRQAKGYHRTGSFSYLALGLLMDKSKFMGPAEGKWRPFNPFYVNGAPYGGLIGRPDAFVRYVQALLNPENVLLSAPYRNMMFEENRTLNGKPTGMALSWFKGELEGHTFYTHAGGGGGYYCEIRIYPQDGVGSLVFFNRTGMTDERYLGKVDGVFFRGG
jgi:CubicO group peptidase (beta-lactamase class C family)